MAEPSEIYEFIVTQSRPYQFPGAWSKLRCAPGFFLAPDDPDKLLEDLRSTYSVDDLCASGAVTRLSDDAYQLTPHLAAPNAVLFAVREQADGKPVDLWAHGGSIRQDKLPLVLLDQEYHVENLLADGDRRCYIAFSMADVAILWSMGRPAALPSGLDQIVGRHIDDFCRWMGVPRRGTDAVENPLSQWPMVMTETPNQRSLVLVGCSLEAFDRQEPSPVQSIKKQFQEFQKNLYLRFDGLEIWAPTPEEMDRIQFCVGQVSHADVEIAFADSVDESCRDLTAPPFVPQETPNSFGDALNRWQDLQGSPANSHAAKDAWDLVEQLLERDIVGPLRRQAAESADAIDRNRLEVLADISRILHPQGIMLAERLADAIRNKGIRAAALPHEEFRQLIALVDRTIKLNKEGRSSLRPKKKR